MSLAYAEPALDRIWRFLVAPPRRIIEPLKLALAICIIYAIAFYMDWGKAYWATVAAISVNLLSSGLTIYRGLIRTLGTAIGGFLGLAVIAMFPQDRWAYMLAATVVLFFMGYKCTGLKEPYFYLIILITFMVVMAGVQQYTLTDSKQAFDIVTLRVTQTWMGSVVMIFIMVYIYPYRTVDEFEGLARRRWGIQRKLYDSYRGMMFGQPPAEETKQLRLDDVPLYHYSMFKLHGAQEDTFEMMELGHDWHHYIDLTVAQYNAMEGLRESLAEAEGLDLANFLPNLEAVMAELDRRFEQTDRMLAKQPPTYVPQHTAVSLNEAETRALPPLQQAAVRMVRRQLEKLEEVSLSIYDGIAKIRMFERPAGAHDDHHGHGHGHGGHWFALDPVRLVTTISFVVAVWVAFLVWIYVYDVPRGSLYPCFVVITASIAAYRPEKSDWIYGVAWLVGAALAGLFYVFIMHQLSGHLQLSIGVAAGVFLLQYWLYPHVHPIARIFTTIGFTIVIDAENHQHYSLVIWMQQVLWMGTAIFTTLAVRFMFLPPQPDKNLLRSLDRFFRHATLLISAEDAEGKADQSLSRRLRMVFYRNSILEDASMVALFAWQIDYRWFPRTTPEQVQDLVRSVYALGHRVEVLVEARKAPLSQRLEAELIDERRDWQEFIEEWFRRRPGAAQASGLAADYEARLANLEKRIVAAFERIGEEELTPEEYEGFYGLLGAYRGLSEAILDYARIAADFDWVRWEETRFLNTGLEVGLGRAPPEIAR